MSLLLASGGVKVVNSDGAPNGIVWSGSTATFGSIVTINSDGAPNGIVWSGQTATLSQLIAASAGSWTWSGSTATFSQLIAASSGAWNWSGNTAQVLQPVNINATTGSWVWSGNTALVAQILVTKVPGGHGGGEDEILPGGIRWGSGQRQIEITGLVDPDDEDMRMLVYLIGMLDD